MPFLLGLKQHWGDREGPHTSSQSSDIPRASAGERQPAEGGEALHTECTPAHSHPSAAVLHFSSGEELCQSGDWLQFYCRILTHLFSGAVPEQFLALHIKFKGLRIRSREAGSDHCTAVRQLKRHRQL